MDLNDFLLRELGPITTATNLSVEDNILNKYSRYAYHFRLVMVGETDSRDLNIAQRLAVSTSAPIGDPLNPEPTDPVRQITLAESGVTVGLNLVNVEIQDSVSPNHRFKNTTTVEINMTITEPYGMQLVDKMFAASRSLGVRNWRLAPLFLELTFKCYDLEGNLISGAAENIRKVWKIILVDFNATLTEVGSTYTVKAATSNTQAFMDYYYLIPHSRRITTGGAAQSNPSLDVFRIQAGTVRSFFTELGTQLSRYYAEQRNANSSNPVMPLLIYKFTICPTLGNLQMPQGPTMSQRRASFARADGASNDILVSRGISITSLLDDVLASLIVIGNDERTAWWSRPLGTRETTGGRVLLPKVEVIVDNVGWDAAMNDYVREFHFVVSVTESTRPVPTRQWGRTYQDSPAQQQDRLTQLNANRTLRKAYPYYYTGLNTEIIHLDLTFQNLHIIPLPLANTTPLSPQDAARVTILETQITQYRTQLQALERLISEDIPGVVGPRGQAQRLALQQAIQSREEELIRVRNEALRRGLAFFDDNYLETLQARVGNNITVDPVVQRQLQDQLRQSTQDNADANRVSSRSFVEDETTLFSNDPGYYTYAADIRDVTNRMSRSSVGGPPENIGRQLYGSILSQIYDKPAMHLTEIEMNIKGDPYWLGKTNLERTLELETLVTSTSTGLDVERFGSRPDNFANYYDYDAHFLLLFRAGQPPDPDTGFQNLNLSRRNQEELTGSVFFAAVYQTIEVTHVFQNGQFTQKIKAIRDGLINLEGLRGISGEPATPTPQEQPLAAPEQPAAPPAIPLYPTVPPQPAAPRPPSPSELTRGPRETSQEFNARVRAAAAALAEWNRLEGLRQGPPMAPP